MIAADSEIDADCTMTHDVPLEVAGEVLGDAAMCLIRGRSCRHNLLTLARPGRVRGTSSHRRDAGELSLLDDAHGTVAQREDSDGPAPISQVPDPSRDHFVWSMATPPNVFPLGPESGSAIDTWLLPVPGGPSRWIT